MIKNIDTDISPLFQERYKLDEVTPLPDRFSPFLAGDDTERIRLKQFFNETNGTYLMWFQPGKKSMGAPGFCHGGLSSTILDESMGSLCWWHGHMVLTVNIDIRYKSKIPIHHQYMSTAQIKTVRGRRIFAEAEILDEQGTVCAVSKGVFLAISPAQISDSAPPQYREQFLKGAKLVELRKQGLSVKKSMEIMRQIAATEKN